MNVTWTFATSEDAATLAEWNFQLIRDEGHRNSMAVPALTDRMVKWLNEDYQAVLFSAENIRLGYALFRTKSELIHIRHFFIQLDQRRRGYGSKCFRILRQEVFPKGPRLTVDVLAGNIPGICFWKAMGYTEYSLTLEIMPNRSGTT